MTRRRLVALASAATILLVGVVAVLAFVAVTKTSYGRSQVRELLLSQIASRLQGTLYVGEIRGGLLTGVTIDSLEIRGPDDSLFIAAGRVTLDYDPRDFLDRRLLLQHITVERPVVHLRRAEDGTWNYRRIFPSGRPRLASPDRVLGDYVVIDSAEISDGKLFLTLPWHPADSLRGARRDSAIAYNLTRKDAVIRRAGREFTRTRRWSDIDAVLSHVRIADPDSAGKVFVIADLSADEFDPPFQFSDIRGTVRNLKDSVWLDLPHFELPSSRGRATGKIVWGSSLPVRYAIDIVGEHVALEDVAWVYPTLPTTGGGRMDLSIRNQPDDLEIIDYAIRNMDVRTTGSRLRGDMTYGVGGPVLIVKDVDLEAAPVDFALLRQLNGKPFPVDWRGTLTGTVRGRGGPLNRFRVDQAQLTFRDAHVPGAVSRGRGHGELDILFPAFTVFRGFDVEADQVDLRTLQHLYPNFPRLNGIVHGRATLDSSWLDVRFRDADIVHRDGPATLPVQATSHVTGSGRVTWGEVFMTYDLDLAADRVAFGTLAKSYPMLPLRGTYAGPVRATGTIESLDLATTLTGPAGTMAVDGHFDLYPAGYAARATGSITALDLRTLLERPDLPATALTGRFDTDVRGDSLTDLIGRVAVEVDRSLIGRLRVYPSVARMRFAAGEVQVDTLTVETSAATLHASGMLGITDDRRGSLSFSLAMDSIGGIRPWLRGLQPVGDSGVSLAGRVRAVGALEGSLERLGITGELAGDELVIGVDGASALSGRFVLGGLPNDPRGLIIAHATGARVAGVLIDTLGITVAVRDAEQARVSGEVISANGPRGLFAGDLLRQRDSTAVLLDTLTLQVGDTAAWRLAGPTRLVSRRGDIGIESLVLRHSDAGVIRIDGTVPVRDSVQLRITGDSISLAELGTIFQSRTPLAGRLRVDGTIAGVRDDPVMRFTGGVRTAQIGELRVDRLTGEGRYDDRRLHATLQLYRGQQPAFTATAVLPVDLSLVPISQRLLEEPLLGSVIADSVSLAIVETFSSQLQNATGRAAVRVNIGGTWKRPLLTGGIRVADGAVGLVGIGTRLERINADVVFAGDSVHLRRLTAWTRHEEAQAADTASLTGFVRLGDWTDPALSLRLFARDFRAIDRGGVARLDVSTGSRGLQVTGSARGALLTGTLRVERGQIYIPELLDKRPVDLNDPELASIVDTSVFSNRRLLPDVPSEFVKGLTLRDVRIEIGPEVWLRSAEANIQLGGSVGVTTAREVTWAGFRQQQDTIVRLALEGALSASRGTYRLNLGPVQRDFQVDSGTVTFYGEPDLNPTLDISALHVVRQQNKQDIGIRVHIGGTLSQPALALSSAEGLPISESDLLSYLVTGTPNFGGSLSAEQTATSVLLPTLGSLLGARLTGGTFDLVQVQTRRTAARFSDLGSSTFRQSLFEGTTLGVGKQWGNRTFWTLNAGLCPLLSDAESGEGTLGVLGDALGLKVEHRFNHGFSLEVGYEPASTAFTCNQSATRGTVSTPRQLGLDVFRAWTF